MTDPDSPVGGPIHVQAVIHRHPTGITLYRLAVIDLRHGLFEHTQVI
jgi:hypothetical protein